MTWTDDIRRKGKGKAVAEFYEHQNEQITDMLKPLATLINEGQQSEADNALKVKIAINLSLFFNIALAAIQLYAAISSLSLALFASCIDAVFDPFGEHCTGR